MVTVLMVWSRGGSHSATKRTKVRGVSYNVESFLRQCCDQYLASFGNDSKLKLKYAATPFLDESQDQKLSAAGAPAPGDPSKAHTCPWCCNLFEPNSDTKGDRAKEFRSAIAATHEIPNSKQCDSTEVDEVNLNDNRIHRNAASVIMKVM